jgi:hypothetical protein
MLDADDEVRVVETMIASGVRLYSPSGESVGAREAVERLGRGETLGRSEDVCRCGWFQSKHYKSNCRRYSPFNTCLSRAASVKEVIGS